MLLSSPAIVLAINPWAHTSHIVTWLTEEYGKVITSVKGACRPRSAFLGQYDLFYTCGLCFYSHEREGIHAIRECWPLELREPLRVRWRAGAAAAYIADLTARATVGPQESRGLFALLAKALDRLASDQPPDPRGVILWYEIHLLREIGLVPDMTLCPQCHTPEMEWLRFSFASGRFVCPHRAPAQPGEATVSLRRDVRELCLKLFRSPFPIGDPAADLPDPERNLDENVNPLLGLSRFLGMFIRFHLDVPSAVRRVAWEMTETKVTQNSAKQENKRV